MRLRRLAVGMTAIVGIAATAFLYAAHPAKSSDHQDAPAVLARPGADITDVYVFPSPRNAAFVDFVINVHPLIPAGTSGNIQLDPTVVYNIKASHGPMGTLAPADSGFQILPIGYGPQQKILAFGHYAGTDWGSLGEPLGVFGFNRPAGSPLAGGITAFAGPRADPFFFDLFQFFTILPDRDYANPRTGDQLGTSTPTFNGFTPGTLSGPGGYACSTAPSTNALTQINGGFDVVSIVFEVPRSLIVRKNQSPIIHVWATTSVIDRSWGGHIALKQIELLSRPAVKELFEKFADHAVTNASEPYADPTIRDSIKHFMLNVAGRSPAIASTVQAVLYPNEIAADISQPGPAAYLGVETGGATGGKFGGRGLTDDVIGTSLGVVFGNTVPALGLTPDDGKENACLAAEHVTSGQGGVQTQAAYPYLAVPH